VIGGDRGGGRDGHNGQEQEEPHWRFKNKKTFATVSYLLLHLYTLLENQINVRKFWPPYLLISSFFFYDPIKRAADS
jgi:hypothetical protein